MDYTQKLQFHYRPPKGWIDDPNGLVYFKGYYHVFFQYCPNYEIPWVEPMGWGHARTKDFLNWEDLPVAIWPDQEYDNNGCWSGTATVKDDRLYLFYASVHTPEGSEEKIQTVSVAYSEDGIHFEKYKGNPVIDGYPADGCPDFRDPAVCRVGDEFYCVMATGHVESETGRLLLYKSKDLLKWDYVGIMKEWDGCRYAECPSFINAGDKFILTASVLPYAKRHYFSVMFGSFENEKFIEEVSSNPDRGPDQYAGQSFRDHKGRNIILSWFPGWKYKGYAPKDIGCMSCPKEIKLVDGKIYLYPVEELRHLLKDEDPAVARTESGFVIERTNRDPVVYEGPIDDIKILRDGYMVEVFVNGGEVVYTALL